LLDINFAQIFIAFTVLLFSLTVHEMAHAWTADLLGDPTARMLGRVSINPIVHADLFGTVLFPVIAMATGVPLIGWAKPVPVNVRQLRRQHRDYVLVAAAGPLANLLLAVIASTLLVLIPVTPVTLGQANASAPIAALLSRAIQLNVLLFVFNLLPIPPLDGGNVISGLLPRSAAQQFDRIKPYGFVVLYALILSDRLWPLILPPSNLVFSLLPTK
jgi:Zn-dependent protease